MPGCAPHRAWTRQHAAITIDAERDVITDIGREVLAYVQRQQIAQVLIMGVHTNMCVLHRTFAIKQLVRWGCRWRWCATSPMPCTIRRARPM